MGTSTSCTNHCMVKLLVLAALCGLGAKGGLVQDDGTVRDSSGTLCASNFRNQVRLRTCDTSDVLQIFDKAHFEATGQIKSTADNTCWWVPSISDANQKNTNQRIWLIRCDTSSPRLDANQLIWSADGDQIRNVYTNSVTANHCVALRSNGYPLKMKPCSHNKTFGAST